MRIEQDLRLPASRTNRIGGEYSVVVPTEVVPPEIIKAIVINPEAQRFLPRRFRFLLSKEWIENACRMTVAPKPDTTNILTPGFWGRSLPLGYGIIPFGEYIGGTVMGKGGFLTGRKYVIGENQDHSSDPLGFFGTKDAEWEITIGNLLLRNNFRAGLPLWYVVFKNQSLENWLLSQWSSKQKVCELITSGLGIVKRNGDEPVFMARITGVTERLNIPLINPPALARMVQKRRAEFSRAIRLLREEAGYSPRHFKGYLRGKVELPEVIAVLNKLVWRNPLNQKERTIFAYLVAGIFACNSQALQTMHQRGIPKVNSADAHLSLAKDIDLGLFSQDFEGIRPTPYNSFKNRLNYADFIASWLEFYLREFTVFSQLPANSITQDQLDRFDHLREAVGILGMME